MEIAKSGSQPSAKVRQTAVWFGPGERYGHGASPTATMTHIALAEMLDGKAVEWMGHVTDERHGR